MLDWASKPPARAVLFQVVKFVRVEVRVMLFPADPAVVAVTVTVVAVADGVQPAALKPRVHAVTPGPFLKMALARLSALVVELPPVTRKFVPLFEPSTPLVVVALTGVVV